MEITKSKSYRRKDTERRFDDEELKIASLQQQNINNQSKSYGRKLFVNDPDSNTDFGFSDNKARTSKYTLWNFLPLFLWENLNPMTKFANFYFVCVAILECIPSISLTSGRPQSLGALSFVLLVEAINSIRDDLNRHRADAQVNASLVEVLNKEKCKFEKKPQGELRVGDIVKVSDGDIFPADLVFLRSGEEKASKTCWINTKSLDGETDNKLRQAMKCTSEYEGRPVFTTVQELASLSGMVNCELPNNLTTDFSGVMNIQLPNPSAGISHDVSESISIKNMLLRGCILKNTNYAYGAVVSTGKDTKVEYSSEKPTWWKMGNGNSKVAMLTRRLNRVIYLMVAILLVLCVLGSLLENVYSNHIIRISWYLDTSKATFWLSFFRFFLLCYQFIPVSLYVTLSLVYSIQGRMMQSDRQLYDEANDEPMRVRTSTLNDDLGQVGYIFTDKTGTLTANLMQFRKCIVDGISYGKGESDIGRAVKGIQEEPVKVVTDKPVVKTGIYKYSNFEDGSDTHPGRTLYDDLRKQDKHGDRLRLFFLHMAINHTVIFDKKEDGTIELSASSPDEQAFVAGSFCQGVEFQGMNYDTNMITLNVLGEKVEVLVLHIIPYESSRKRMSMIVEMEDGSIYLFTKGADSILLELGDPNLNDQLFLETMVCQVGLWAEEAFRTMVFGYKQLTQESFAAWMSEYEKISNDPGQKELRRTKKPNQIEEMEYELEKGLILQGATAIEDSLQEGVPNALAQLSNAGIHIWMITGDKVGTAKNIAVACNLLKSDMRLIEFTKETVDDLLRNKMEEMIEKDVLKTKGEGSTVVQFTEGIPPSLIQDTEWKMMEAERNGEFERANQILGELESTHSGLLFARTYCEGLASQIMNKKLEGEQMALIIDELFIDYLAVACKKAFLIVAQACKAVIACRARKDQKAKLTRLVRKENREVVTLAIGDGANDVEMIRAAHIGVGIIGKEGTQAVNNADYAIGQFRFLTRMVLVYGHRFYRGITLASLLIFLKNILNTLVQYSYTFLSGLSGIRNQSSLAVIFYNTAFTAFGPLYLAIFDRDIRDKNCYRFPQIHRLGISHSFFSIKLAVGIFVTALWQAAAIMGVFYLGNMGLDYDSGTPEVYLYGMITITATILVANLGCSLMQSTSSAISITAFWFFFLLWILGVLVMSCFRTWIPYYYKNINLMLGNPVNYLLVVLAVAIAILPSLINKVAIKNMRPTLIQIIQEVETSEEMAEQLKKDLEEREKRRAVGLELSTIKQMPKNVEKPELLKVRVDDLEKEKEKSQQASLSSLRSTLSNIPVIEEEGEEEEEREDQKKGIMPAEIEMTECVSKPLDSTTSILSSLSQQSETPLTPMQLSSSSQGDMIQSSSTKSILLSPSDMQSLTKIEGECEIDLSEIPLDEKNDCSQMEGMRMSSRMDLSPISENFTPSASSNSLSTSTSTTTEQPIKEEYWNLPTMSEIKRRKQSLIMDRRGSFFALGRDQSIRSFAGINALYVCTQLHGSSEQQSVNSDTQAELARMVNHHGWKDGVKPKFMGQRKK